MLSGSELLCNESGALAALDSPHAAVDLALLQDRRVLDKMLQLQHTTLPTDNYLTEPNTDIKPSMRKIVTKWMLEVCDEYQCEDQVFLVSVNLLDRFLNTTSVKRSQLQLSACACLLLASKLRQCSYLSIDLLVFCTDNCVTGDEIRQWEILVVAKLRWDLCPVTPIDFVDVLLQQISIDADTGSVRRHAAVLIAVAATERHFISQRPSYIAGAAIMAAMQGLTHASLSNMAPCIENISNMLDSSPDVIQTLLFALEESLKRASGSNSSSNGGLSPDTDDTGSSKQQSYSKMGGGSMMEDEEQMQEGDGKETPVDVFDVNIS
uniref:G1/S-specific cyclin-D3-like n=1 Tax=Hirondellea gigas TaxID=1518452 RepID=A0A6A7G2P5_9CRUS